MSYASVLGCVLSGIEARVVRVEVDIGRGLPAFEVVGQPAGVVRESRDRIRAAVHNCGLEFPAKRITVNLAPAEFRKDDSFLDLPIAIGLLVASGQLPPAAADNLFIGELALDGGLPTCRSTLAAALLARRSGLRLICPAQDLEMVDCIRGLISAGYDDFSQLISALNNGTTSWRPSSGMGEVSLRQSDPWESSGVQGDGLSRRVLRIAAAGRHNLALIGPPGVGKTLLAKILWEMLPPLNEEESMEVAQIYSACGLPIDQALKGFRPFRGPHHTITCAGLVGGGRPIRPGEATLAHRGLLFLDELPEFSRRAVAALREPLESGEILLHRGERQVLFPAAIQLVTAFNLCPCGYHYFQPQRCNCTSRDVHMYLRSAGGALFDRLDLWLPIARPLWEHTGAPAKVGRFPISVEKAYLEVKSRDRRWLTHRLSQSSQRYCQALAQERMVSARGYFQVLSIASTIAALEGSEGIAEQHVAEAWQYRYELPNAREGDGNVS